MEGRAAGRASAPRDKLFGRQHCPQCAYALVAADASQHISEHTIKHMWFCEACGTEFATLVKLRRQVRVASYWRNEEDERRILRCATCDGTVFAEIACVGPADANTACVLCGMTMDDLPFEGGDYFDVLMRVGRPLGLAARSRRTGSDPALSL
jgi:hypothetical protein